MKKLILLLFTLSISFTQQAWIRTFGGTNSDAGYTVQQTSDGGYIVAGYTYSFGAGNLDVYLIKTDSSGDTLWTRTYGGTDEEQGLYVQQTSDGDYIVAGWAYSFGAGSADVYLIKTDSSGDTLWTRTYGGTNHDDGFSVQQTQDNGYVIAGCTGSFGAGNDDVYLIKTDSAGDTLWTRTYGGTNHDDGSSVQQTQDNGYVITGYTYSFGEGNSDVYLIKTDSIGDTLWTKTYGGVDGDWGTSVQQASDGGYIIAGMTYSFGAGGVDVYVIKTNASGDTLWTRTYGGMNGDEGHSIQQTIDGGYIIAGYTLSFGAGSADVYLIKTDSAGDTLWTRTYGGMNDDMSLSAQQTQDNGYIIAGCTGSFGAGNLDVYLIKTDSSGNAALEESQSRKQNLGVVLKAVPNPFTSFTRIPGFEKDDFMLSDITGRVIGKYKGMKIGENLSAGVYFIVSQNKNTNPIWIVKIR